MAIALVWIVVQNKQATGIDEFGLRLKGSETKVEGFSMDLGGDTQNLTSLDNVMAQVERKKCSRKNTVR